MEEENKEAVAIGVSTEIIREEGELSEDGEIIELSDEDSKDKCDTEDGKKMSAKDTTNNVEGMRCNLTHRRVNDKPVQLKRSRVSRKREKQKPSYSRIKESVLRAKYRKQHPWHRSRSPSRERARFPGYCRDVERDRERVLPKSYQLLSNSSSSKFKFLDSKRSVGLSRRIHGSLNKSSQNNLPQATTCPISFGMKGYAPVSTKLSTIETSELAANHASNQRTVPAAVVPLMNLVVDPPPPPPPPPPPLPSSPPPRTVPPPLPPPTSEDRMLLEFKTNAKRKTYRSPRIVPPRSPPGEVDNDYIDLLLEYKQIQKQLENIKREEERAANLLSAKKVEREPEYKLKLGYKDSDLRQKDRAYFEEQSSRETPPWRKHVDNTDYTIEQERSEKYHAEEEDLDELELRLAALASAAKRGSRLERSSATNRSQSKQTFPKQTINSSRKRDRENYQRKSLSSPSLAGKRRHIDDEPPWIRRHRQRREEEREMEEWRLAEEEKHKDERRREIAKILTLANPSEQVERFLRMCQGSSEEERRPLPGDVTEIDDYEEDEMVDNYEVKEMEIDSDISSPTIVIDAGMDEIANDLTSSGMVDMNPTSIDTNCYRTLVPDANLRSKLDPSDYFHPPELPVLLPQHPALLQPPQPFPTLGEYMGDTVHATQEEVQSPVYFPVFQSIDPTSSNHDQYPAIPYPESQIEQNFSHEHTDGSEINVAEPIPENGDEQIEKVEEQSEEQDEAEKLREILLQGMKKKSLQGKDDETYSSRGSSPLTFPKDKNSKVPKTQLPMPLPPRHKPVVISLGSTSDTDDSGDEHMEQPKSKADIVKSIDQFLKDVRQASEDHPLKSPTTPEALKNLPQDKLNEYRKLKLEIKRRESKKTSTKKLSKPPTTAKAIGNKSSRHMKKSFSEGSLKVQIEGGQRTVKPAQAIEKEESLEEKNGSVVEPSDNIKSLPEMPALLTEQDVQELEAKLIGQRSCLISDENILMALQGHMNKRKQILIMAEKKVQKLQEQLSATKRIVNTNRHQIQKYIVQGRALKDKVDQKVTVVNTLERHLLEAGQKVFGEKYVLPSSGVNKGALHLKLKQEKQSRQASDKINELAEEKQRLLQLEKLCGDRIRKLKAAHKGHCSQGTNKMCDMPLGPGSVEEELKRLQTNQLERIITSEKIELTATPDSDLDQDMITVTPRRRRSLLDLQTNGNLLIVSLHKSAADEAVSSDQPTANSIPPLNEKSTMKNCSEDQLRLSSNPPELKKNSMSTTTDSDNVVHKNLQQTKEVFSNFSNSQMTRLRKIQASNLVKFPTSGLTQVASQDPGLCASWWPKQKQCSRKLHTNLGLSWQENEPKQQSQQQRGIQPYSSVLLRFRSYRFNPYFRTKEKRSLSSISFSHKLDVGQILCKFELHGSCNDETCPWQHKVDYGLSKEQQLEDIVSYCPSLASVPSDTPKNDISKYIEEFVIEFSKRDLSIPHEKQQLQLLIEADKAAKTVAPHHVRTEAREWRPAQRLCNVNPKPCIDDQHQALLPVRQAKEQAFEDNIIGEGDLRYWLLSGLELEDMETAVLDSPHDIQLWLKLAYKKLHEDFDKKGIDKALNVFAHALQANKTSEELWLHYLGLYSQRSDTSDLVSLCEQALKYTPSYAIYWKCLGFLTGFDEKEKFCDEVKSWLCNQKDADPKLRSHQLLEIILHQVALCLVTGRLKKGVEILKGVVQNLEGTDESLYWRHLAVSDQTLLSLIHIHLLEFRSLPSSLYDPTSGLQAYLVSTDIGEFGWREGKGSRLPLATLDSLFRDAERQLCKASLADSEYIKISLPLYTNWLHLLTCCKKFDMGMKLCRRVLNVMPCVAKLWMILARLEAKSENMEKAKQALMDGIEACSSNTEIFYNAAQLELQLGNADAALELLEKAVISNYDVDESNSQQCDPNLLYCYVLKQPVPVSFVPPAFKSGVSPSILCREPSRYLWLSYCLLLDLQGDYTQVNEMYEAALGALSDTLDLQALWISYLRHALSQALSCSSAAQQQTLTTRFSDLMHRCLLSCPVRYPVPHQKNLTWLDYRFPNEVIDLLVRSVPRDQVACIYERFTTMMPNNIQLICRSCEEALRQGDRALAHGITTLSLMDHPNCLQLWKTHLRLVQWNSTYSEVKKTFERAIHLHPLVLHIWKDYLLYEIVYGSMTSANSLVARCRRLGVNIDEYVNNLLKSDVDTKT